MIVKMTPELLDSISRGSGEIDFEFGGDTQVASLCYLSLIAC